MAGKGLEGGARDPLLELSGTALRAYMLLLRSRRPMGVRELQHRLGLRSPSTARHHLERLVELGLARRVEGGYVAEPPKTGLLRAYIIVRGRLVPRSLATAAFTLAATLAYAVLPGSDPAAVAVLSVAAALSLLDAYTAYRAAETLRIDSAQQRPS
ncbi:winged helix-turn-helix domain-containing protein [Pyrodictium abyssi]|uniref:LexA repressor DNA-binding domain-containing protein n=1 Tax=Pyrodictium abyssi TaxID=54256 RepID=A0ABN6ZPQ5_9CREN|nr:hypothetical protein PABY_17460 [Pyrodictium abyssi]